MNWSRKYNIPDRCCETVSQVERSVFVPAPWFLSFPSSALTSPPRLISHLLCLCWSHLCLSSSSHLTSPPPSLPPSLHTSICSSIRLSIKLSRPYLSYPFHHTQYKGWECFTPALSCLHSLSSPIFISPRSSPRAFHLRPSSVAARLDRTRQCLASVWLGSVSLQSSSCTLSAADRTIFTICTVTYVFKLLSHYLFSCICILFHLCAACIVGAYGRRQGAEQELAEYLYIDCNGPEIIVEVWNEY